MDQGSTQPLDFAFKSSNPSIIKVVGVGGGGGNALESMYKQGIHDVSFVLCNTDRQALDKSSIPHKLLLGSGLGAGNRPEVAKEAAENSWNDIIDLFSDGTKMVFITAGMGGGTGTGAAPVIARAAKELGILTVGIVTIPFLFEGQKKLAQAFEGIDQISSYVDALLVVNNERLREIFADLTIVNAFKKADDTLTNAAKGIAELITVEGYINLDFRDVNTILRNGGLATMSSGIGEGEHRVTSALADALNSPLLNNNDVFGAKRVLFNLYCTENEFKTSELDEIHEFMLKFGADVEVIFGVTFDNEMDNKVKITFLATGFETSKQSYIKTLEEMRAEVSSRKITGTPMVDLKQEQMRKLEQAARRASLCILTKEQMDNDQILDLVERIPTYNRDQNFKLKLNDLIAQMEKTTTSSQNNSNGTIQF